MKRLTITYGGNTLFDGDVDSISWSDENGIRVESRLRKVANGNGMGGFLESLMGKPAAQVAEEKRAEYKTVSVD